MKKVFLLITILLINTCFALTLQSADFKNGQFIPEQFTLVGSNISPQLSWSGAPKGTQSYALIVVDPDAPNKHWYHWVVVNIPGSITQLAQAENFQQIPVAKQLNNTWGHAYYEGPFPPANQLHHYHFILYALNANYSYSKSKMVDENLLHWIKEHTLEQADLMGLFQRKNQ